LKTHVCCEKLDVFEVDALYMPNNMSRSCLWLVSHDIFEKRCRFIKKNLLHS